jgi:hypothetical protein
MTAVTIGEALKNVEDLASNRQYSKAGVLLGKLLEFTANDRSAQIQLGIRLTQLLLDAGALEPAFIIATQIYRAAGPIDAASITQVDVIDAMDNYLLAAAAAKRAEEYARAFSDGTSAALEATAANWLAVWRLVELARLDAKLGNAIGRSSTARELWYDRVSQQLDSPFARETLAAVQTANGGGSQAMIRSQLARIGQLTAERSIP